YPFFPELTDVWADGENWRLGHWLTGRLGAVSLQALVRHLCARGGLAAGLVDVSDLAGQVEGFVISALEPPRSSIAVLARHFGFDGHESEGRIVFRMRGHAPVAALTMDDLIAAASANGELIEFERAQETELPQALKWSLARADGDYDAALVEARRITVDTTRIAAETFPLAVPPEEAERRVRRALQEAWVGRESATFRLPPSRLALDPGDVLQLEHDARPYYLRLVSAADSEARSVTAIREDRAVYDLPPGGPRASSLARSVLFGGSQVIFLDLPQLSADEQPHQPLVSVFARPWPGTVAVYRSPSLDGFTQLTTVGVRGNVGVTLWDFYAGPTACFDLGNELAVEMQSGSLASVSDLELFGGANAFAIETAPGVWEVVQAGVAELIGPSQYRLTRLLRGQRGTDGDMVAMVPAGARVVVLGSSLATLPIAQADVGLPWNWRIGPVSLPYTDAAFTAAAFTPLGRGLEPFSVGHVAQPYLSPRTPGDLTISWLRRSRDLVADSWVAVEVPLTEDAEAYEVDILDGATVKRTLAAATTSVVYTSAQQIADFGAELAPGDTLEVRIAQLSSLVGRGTERTFTLNF
ncbi:MAG: hypothetical protein CVT83_05950, partial [Alphaproteobacteria bacterium HGW-Alphaproteobacteria-5]